MSGLGPSISWNTSTTHITRKTNVVCPGPIRGDGLVLSGHMDVVPTEGQPWTGDPFKLQPKTTAS